ncbi:MAG: DUF192 domain-containing protein [Candidatus Uhrbacteria bacterium]
MIQPPQRTHEQRVASRRFFRFWSMVPAFVVMTGLIVFYLIVWIFGLWKTPHPTVRFPDGTIISVEIADSPEERRIGLSDHVYLDQDRGMLFLFDDLSRPAFWMKGMRFPIDIVWLRDGIVVGIEPDMPVSTDVNPPSVRPNGDINEVLELNAGIAAEHGLKRGDSLDIQLP